MWSVFSRLGLWYCCSSSKPLRPAFSDSLISTLNRTISLDALYCCCVCATWTTAMLWWHRANQRLVGTFWFFSHDKQCLKHSCLHNVNSNKSPANHIRVEVQWASTLTHFMQEIKPYFIFSPEVQSCSWLNSHWPLKKLWQCLLSKGGSNFDFHLPYH